MRDIRGIRWSRRAPGAAHGLKAGTARTGRPANITGVIPTGICAIEVVNGDVVYAAGRVGSPPVIIKSIDGGENWVGTDLSSYCKMILDIHFQSPDTGFVFAGTDADIASSNAIIIRTTDGGITWNPVYTSTRTYEIIWKAWFPSHNVGYATIQSYNTSTTQRYVVKTLDGGMTWFEQPLANTGIREFGIGFINDTVGWVGGESTGYQTLDGGLTWTSKNIGQYANKLSIVNNTGGIITCYAVGLHVFKMTNDLSTSGVNEVPIKNNDLLVYPNPVYSGSYVTISLDKIQTKIVKSEILNVNGKSIFLLFNSYHVGTRESPFLYRLPELPNGNYIIKFTDEYGKEFCQKILILN